MSRGGQLYSSQGDAVVIVHHHGHQGSHRAVHGGRVGHLRHQATPRDGRSKYGVHAQRVGRHLRPLAHLDNNDIPARQGDAWRKYPRSCLAAGQVGHIGGGANQAVRTVYQLPNPQAILIQGG